jgi:hypothetical protein
MMSLGTVLLIILILILLGALPTWPYSTGWGYYPSGGLGLIVLLLVILLLTGAPTLALPLVPQSEKERMMLANPWVLVGL